MILTGSLALLLCTEEQSASRELEAFWNIISYYKVNVSRCSFAQAISLS